MARSAADIGTIYVIGGGESTARVVISGFKLINFVIEPDGKSGYLSAYADSKTFLLPFEVP